MSKDETETLLTVRDWLRWAASRFVEAELYYGHGTDNAIDEARFLVFSCLSLPQDSGDWVLDARLTDTERRRLAQWLDRRIHQRLPAPYICGEAWFAGLPFHVDERVLVPRSPIAELITAGFAPWLTERESPAVLDLCCGSAGIGIACALHLQTGQVDLADLSADALAVARRNIARHGLEDRCEAIQSDLFEALTGRCYQLIVSNPPYVDSADMAALPAEFRYEPRLGLAAGIDGLDIVRRILRVAREFLSDDGILVVEVGNSAPALEEAFAEIPFLWLEFEHGGQGVFLLTAAQLDEHAAQLQ